VITIRKAQDRGHFDHGWLDTWHTFSFGSYYDPQWMGYRKLRVINDDIVRQGRGFGMHPHDNMEILTYILDGELAHKDSTGSAGTIRPGEIQRMSAGSGILHSEYNPSADTPVHLLQIWIEPNVQSVKPEYEQRPIPAGNGRGPLTLLAAPDGKDGAMRIHADARVWAGKLPAGAAASVPLELGGHAWLHVARGHVRLEGQELATGDGAAIEGQSQLDLKAIDESEVLLFDLA
jgi:quercetin 2,3-dioxygenase